MEDYLLKEFPLHYPVQISQAKLTATLAADGWERQEILVILAAVWSYKHTELISFTKGLTKKNEQNEKKKDI